MINKILWTGGWDSTYRLLDLVLNKKKVVQPYYVFDTERKSTGMEIKTMENIKALIYKMDPTSKNRVLDTVTIDLANIPKNEKITSNFKKILTHSFIGSQHDWLARYVDSLGINDLELGVHLDDNLQRIIEKEVVKVEEIDDSFYKVKSNPSDDNLKIFSYYNFPLLDMTKLDMERKSKESGFGHIMEVTWFCHWPFNDKPCGMCNPCKYTRQEGLGRRVSNVTLLMLLNRKINSKYSGLKKRLNFLR
ncbi:7-cyano-7-deazaguanine synthase [Virgibacillus necropolis]|uniref:7-cyano-7-deazaguanine synthase n=1 Tax=Virgibacillus necropolis TaxID=163877 RepID=A0A221M9C9_9BACI|nr:7-cyano-7-deazaguanine synthase [Virgibacillus necropolis]ASN04232.1 hypothetical protein CFK40_04020 [Virgibacillus necropolis]